MYFQTCDDTPYGRSVEFAEENEFGYKHRTVNVHINRTNRVIAVTLYTFRYGRVLWLNDDQNETDWMNESNEQTKYVKGNKYRVFISLVGAIGDPDKYFQLILDDLRPNINNYHLYSLLNKVFVKQRVDFNPERYLQASSDGKKVKLGLVEQIQTYFLVKKNNKTKKYVPVLFPQWTAKAMEENRR